MELVCGWVGLVSFLVFFVYPFLSPCSHGVAWDFCIRMGATSLPPTCGEATEIPGTPCVGCVAVLQYDMGVATGFSCCVVASSEEVYLLGPDLNRSDGSLASVQLWRAHAQMKSVRIMSLVAFLLQPAATHASGTFRDHKPAPDEVCAVVAWEYNGGEKQHLTALFFPLVRVLSMSSNAPVVATETSFLHSRNQQRIFRLFYHPMFSVPGDVGLSSGVTHVVLCSCYNETVQREASLKHGEERNRRVLSPGDTRGLLLGEFSFVVCRMVSRDPCEWEVTWVAKAPACVPPWLGHSSRNGVVSAFAVQKGTPNVIAALGTTSGRIILLHSDGNHVTRRFSGPIADMAFVDTRCIHGDARFRYSVVTKLLQRKCNVVPENSGTTPRAESIAEMSECLVFLDSLGRVIVLRAINATTPIVQIVQDVQQFITLAGHRPPCQGSTNASNPDAATFSTTTTTSAVSAIVDSVATGEVSMSSKNFFDLSSLRLFFQRRKQKDIRSDQREHEADKTPAGEMDVNAVEQPSQEDARLAGHILSRGLLSLVTVPGPQGHVELFVSTMEQSIVSILFDVNENLFSIAGLVVAPEPMFFVGIVDFFNTGVADLVTAGMHHVLVAPRSRSQQKAKASLLLRLLARKDLHSVTTADIEEA